ncbi:hypothetical protein J7F03_40330 [Streptomyces sp. ISL-43]|uniref:hypothetical protein n=1 Tax=Streptomyces sp. ISL-43 TaxID=2819183 RepID=UPI001BEBCB13|nr:hypothetical protein [Streptomyces sp. ISL-43]MBT2453157.1 hypothetical protein [Streptomyces sp. ISL-43]
MCHQHFPHDLIRIQLDWIRTYEALSRLTPTQSPTRLRRELLDLSRALAAHPYWAIPGRSTAGRVELLRQARARRWAWAA